MATLFVTNLAIRPEGLRFENHLDGFPFAEQRERLPELGEREAVGNHGSHELTLEEGETGRKSSAVYPNVPAMESSCRVIRDGVRMSASW